LRAGRPSFARSALCGLPGDFRRRSSGFESARDTLSGRLERPSSAVFLAGRCPGLAGRFGFPPSSVSGRCRARTGRFGFPATALSGARARRSRRSPRAGGLSGLSARPTGALGW
jgi:hypothetical protein